MSNIITWPGGWAACEDDRRYWHAYSSPIDAHREFHLTSGGGSRSQHLVTDDYGILVPA